MEKTGNFLKENLLRLRNKAGLTQAELAGLAKITLTGYQKIEYGKSKGKSATVSKIAKALGVTVELLERDPSLPELTPIDSKQVTTVTLTEAQIKTLTEEAGKSGAQAVIDAIKKPGVSNQDDSPKAQMIQMIEGLNDKEAKLMAKALKNLLDRLRDGEMSQLERKIK